MEKKVLFIIFSIVLISLSPQVFAEDNLDTLLVEKNALLIEQQQIIFEVGKYSDVQVKHVIETGAWNLDRPRVIEALSGSCALAIETIPRKCDLVLNSPLTLNPGPPVPHWLFIFASFVFGSPP